MIGMSREPKQNIPSVSQVTAAAACTPGLPTRTAWYRAVAAKCGVQVKTEVVLRICREHGIVVPPRAGKRTNHKGD